MSSPQSQRVVLNVLLLIMLGVLSAVLWWWENSQSVEQAKPLLALPRSYITTISIDRKLETPNPETIQFKREGEAWFMTHPLNVPANPVKMTQLLTLSREEVLAEYPAEQQNLADFGLKPLSNRVSFNEEVIGYGGSNPVTNQRYLLHHDHIKLVSEVVYGLVVGDVLDLVARNLVPVDEEIEQLQLPNQQVSVSMALRSDWHSASAMRIERVDLPVEGEKQVKITLKNHNVLEWVVRLDQNELKLINRANGLVYVLPATLAPKLLEAKVSG